MVITYTAGTAGNIRASASLGASATANYNLDYSAKAEGRIHIKNTPGGSVSATRGLKVEVFVRYGTTPTTGESAWQSWTMPSATASTAESIDLQLPTAYYNLKITNLDGAQAVTVEITEDTITIT